MGLGAKRVLTDISVSTLSKGIAVYQSAYDSVFVFASAIHRDFAQICENLIVTAVSFWRQLQLCSLSDTYEILFETRSIWVSENDDKVTPDLPKSAGMASVEVPYLYGFTNVVQYWHSTCRSFEARLTWLGCPSIRA